MTEKNTSLNATGFGILVGGLDKRKPTISDNAISYFKDGKILCSENKKDTLAHLNGSLPDDNIAKYKMPLLKKTAEEVLPAGAFHVSDEIPELLRKKQYNRLFNQLYANVIDNEQLENCEQTVEYFKEKFGKENVEMLDDALVSAKSERQYMENMDRKEGKNIRQNDNANVKVMMKSKY